jgi:hypothetical protein
MDVETTQTSAKGSNPAALSNQANDQKELAWAFVGLLLWSGVVLVGIFGVGYIVGHAILHWW